MKPARLAILRAVSSLPDMPAPVVVQGLQSNFEAAPPPVIVNPMAEAEALMSWGIDQLTAVNALLKAMSNSAASSEVAAFAGAVAHLTAQAEVVVRAALQVHRDSFMD